MLICVCLRILDPSRIPQYDLWETNPSFLRWFCHTCTDTEINFDLRQDARPPPTRPPVSPVPFVLGRELPSAPHVEPGAGVSGSSALTASMGGLPMEQAKLPGSSVAHSSGLSMEQSSSSSLTPAHPSTRPPKTLPRLDLRFDSAGRVEEPCADVALRGDHDAECVMRAAGHRVGRPPRVSRAAPGGR
jgi:hypothetical protein